VIAEHSEEKTHDTLEAGLAAKCLNLLLKLFKEEVENIGSNCVTGNNTI